MAIQAKYTANSDVLALAWGQKPGLRWLLAQPRILESQNCWPGPWLCTLEIWPKFAARNKFYTIFTKNFTQQPHNKKEHIQRDPSKLKSQSNLHLCNSACFLNDFRCPALKYESIKVGQIIKLFFTLISWSKTAKLYISQKPQPGTKPGQAKPNFWLLASSQFPQAQAA